VCRRCRYCIHNPGGYSLNKKQDAVNVSWYVLFMTQRESNNGFVGKMRGERGLNAVSLVAAVLYKSPPDWAARGCRSAVGDVGAISRPLAGGVGRAAWSVGTHPDLEPPPTAAREADCLQAFEAVGAAGNGVLLDLPSHQNCGELELAALVCRRPHTSRS